MSQQKTTRCPHCQTVFRVREEQLQAAAGKVRCGKCMEVFNGLDCLIATAAPMKPAAHPERAPSPRPQQSRTSPSQSSPPSSDDDDFLIDDNFDLSRLGEIDSHDAGSGPRRENPPVPAGKRQPSPGADIEPTEGGAAGGDVVFSAGTPMSTLTDELDDLAVPPTAMSSWRADAGDYIAHSGNRGRRGDGGHRWLWAAASAVAALVLAGQLLYFNSLAVGRDSPLWPLAATFCNVAGCPLQAAVDLNSIASSGLVVRSHPDFSGALLVNAVIVNRAGFPQPFPPLTLTFEDLQGRVLARRTFTPAEYLDGELSAADAMPDGQGVELSLAIVDPGRDAVSFRLQIGDRSRPSP